MSVDATVLDQFGAPVSGVSIFVTPSGPFTPPTVPSGGVVSLSLLNSYVNGSGNAAHIAWSDDSSTLYEADEENNYINTIFGSFNKMSVPTAATAVIAAGSQSLQYVWAVAQKSGILVATSSYNQTVERRNPSTWAQVWQKTAGTGAGGTNNTSASDIVTDGTYVYVPYVDATGGNGGLQVLNASDGSQAALVRGPNPFGACYTLRLTTFNSHTYALYSVSTKDAQFQTLTGAVAGVYVFDVTTPTSPTYTGKMFSATLTDFEVNGSTLYTLENSGTSSTSRDTINAYNIATILSPSKTGSFTAQATTGYSGGTTGYVYFMGCCLNGAGTRLYASYDNHPLNSLAGQNDAPAGWVIFDITGANPALITSPSQVDGSGNLYGQVRLYNGGVYFVDANGSGFIRLSPDGTKIAQSIWQGAGGGVAFWSMSGDTATFGTIVAVTGETKDGIVDSSSNVYLPVGDNLQVYNSSNLIQNVDLDFCGGGFEPFKDGRYIVPQTQYGFKCGVIDITLGPANFVYLADLGIGSRSNPIQAARYNSGNNTLYTAANNGLYWYTVGAAPTYTLTLVNSFATSTEFDGISLPFTGSDGNMYIGVISLVSGGFTGVVQLTGAGAPKYAMQDTSAFTRHGYGTQSGTNGPFAKVEVVGNYLYFGCHRSGVQIYAIAGNPPTFTLQGTILPFNATWVEASTDGKLLLINSYHGSGGQPTDGLYIADLRTSATNPTISSSTTSPIVGGPGWRSRIWNSNANVWKGGLGGGGWYSISY